MTQVQGSGPTISKSKGYEKNMKNQSGVGGHLGAERGLAAAADLGEGVRGHCAGGCLLLHAHTARGRAAAGTGKHALQQVVLFQQPAILFRTRKKTASPTKSAVSAAICTGGLRSAP